MSPLGVRYHLVTELEVTAGREQVWEALVGVNVWPSWWSWLRRVEVLSPGGEDGVGGRYRGLIATPTRYRLRSDIEVLELDHLESISLRATGDLVGWGDFRLSDAGSAGTALEFVWRVRTTKWWMNLAAPVARGAFIRNHDLLMDDFALGLAYGTGSELVSVGHRSLRRGDPGFFQPGG